MHSIDLDSGQVPPGGAQAPLGGSMLQVNPPRPCRSELPAITWRLAIAMVPPCLASQLANRAAALPAARRHVGRQRLIIAAASSQSQQPGGGAIIPLGALAGSPPAAAACAPCCLLLSLLYAHRLLSSGMRTHCLHIMLLQGAPTR